MRHAERQKKYFASLPDERRELIKVRNRLNKREQRAVALRLRNNNETEFFEESRHNIMLGYDCSK